MRGLFERERRLLGLLARTGRDVIVASFRSILGRADFSPGLVVSIQTFGSYGANFHPHLHMLAADGGFTRAGESLDLPYFNARLVEEAFRRQLIHRLHRAERLSERFARSLTGWVHSGVSVHGTQRFDGNDTAGTERLARYITRAVIALARIELDGPERVRVTTPPDPRSGATVMRLDAIDLRKTGRRDPFEQRAPPPA